MSDNTAGERRKAIDLNALRAMATRAARGKRRNPDVAGFLLDADVQLLQLQRELQARRYWPGRGRPIWIEDPKRRLITVIPFRDRVVQHLLIDGTLGVIELRMAPQSFACRAGYGTHRALRRAAAWTRQRQWVLKVDVRKFFPSIDHGNLRRMLLRVTPVDWRWLSDRFVDAPYDGERVTSWFPGDDLLTPLARPHGLPIGSLTSQIWANLYLSPIDHLLASELGIGSFVRYCDEWLIWDDDPGRLREALSRMHEHATRLRLRLHPRKTRLHRATDSIRVQPETLRPISSLCSAKQVIWRTTGGRQGRAFGSWRGASPLDPAGVWAGVLSSPSPLMRLRDSGLEG